MINDKTAILKTLQELRQEFVEELESLQELHSWGRVYGMEIAIEMIDHKIEDVQNEAYFFPEVFGEPIEMLIDGIWVKGKVINDYRSRDGIVNMETADGKKYWCGCERTDCYRRPNECDIE